MKQGHIADRLAAAQFAKHQRARYRAGQVAGSFTFNEWSRQVAEATKNKLAVMTQRRNQFAREDRAALERQCAAEIQSEWRAR